METFGDWERETDLQTKEKEKEEKKRRNILVIFAHWRSKSDILQGKIRLLYYSSLLLIFVEFSDGLIFGRASLLMNGFVDGFS
jgi:hypothetical protein